jgi:hypothetical protein
VDPAAAPGVALTDTEKIAIRAVLEEAKANAERDQEVNNEVSRVDADIAKEHPGYHLDHRSWTIVPDAPKPK